MALFLAIHLGFVLFFLHSFEFSKLKCHLLSPVFSLINYQRVIGAGPRLTVSIHRLCQQLSSMSIFAFFFPLLSILDVLKGAKDNR